MTHTNGRAVVLVDGCRLPFLRSGTDYVDLTTYDLGRMALKGLLTRTGIDPAQVDRVVMGSVVQNVHTANVAREAALGAGFPDTVPAFTVSMACISSNQAVTAAVELIGSGQADIVVAGGTETASDVPIQFKRTVRKKLMAARKFKSPGDYLKLIRKLRPSDLLPEVPAIAEYSTGETMGQSADGLAAMFGVSREAQDEYALRSHQKAAQARDDSGGPGVDHGAGDHGMVHLAESPWVMVGPMVALAVLSVVAGVLGSPPFDLGPIAKHWMSEYLAPKAEVATSLGVAVFSLIVAGAGILTAWLLYGARKISPERVTIGPLHRLFSRKYYMDDLAENLIMTRAFYRVGCGVLDWFDRNMVDGLVDTVGWFGRNLGRALAQLQPGQLQGYGTAAVVGVGLIVILYLLWG